MFIKTAAAFAAVIILPTLIKAQTCNINKKCPADTPACGEWGYCGKRGSIQSQSGCNPRDSYSSDACQPIALCRSSHTVFNDLSRVQTDGSELNNDPSVFDWVVDQGAIIPTTSGTILLSITENSLGTRMRSATGLVLGKLSVTMRTTNMTGIITTAIFKGNTGSEIDMEAPGVKVTELQTVAWRDGQTLGGDYIQLNTIRNQYFNTYEVEVLSDRIIWSVNGTAVRTLKKADTLKNGVNVFPEAAMFAYISVWGVKGNQWAGGDPDWTKADSQLGFYAEVAAASVTCYDDPSQTPGATGYEFTGSPDPFGSPSMVYSTRALVYAPELGNSTDAASINISNSSTIIPTSSSANSAEISSALLSVQSSQANNQAGVTASSIAAVVITGSASEVPSSIPVSVQAVSTPLPSDTLNNAPTDSFSDIPTATESDFVDDDSRTQTSLSMVIDPLPTDLPDFLSPDNFNTFTSSLLPDTSVPAFVYSLSFKITPNIYALVILSLVALLLS